MDLGRADRADPLRDRHLRRQDDPSGDIIYESELFRETPGRWQTYIAYPFSRASRFEVGAAARHISFGREREAAARRPVQRPGPRAGPAEAARSFGHRVRGGERRARVRHRALRADQPILGQRYRFEVSPTVGGLKYVGVLADYRRYVMPIRPITLAGRVIHYARYGSGGNDPRITPLFIGYPNLVRGYDVNSFSASECGNNGATCPVFEQLVGSRIGVANLELRLPLLVSSTGATSMVRSPSS